jgi:pimeloyl-ACP methyl ester carboxylesterase
MTERDLDLFTGLRYRVYEWDAPTDHTVVLLHGFLDFATGFAPLVEAGLEGRFHIVAPDLRGHGDSGRVGAGGYYHFADYLPDLHDVVRQLGRTRLSLVGHSMGGSIASFYAGSYPERVHKLALLEGLGPPEERQGTSPERVVSWIDAWERARRRGWNSYASIEEAAARLAQNDPLLDPALALRLAERGTSAGPDGRRRFKHDPLHLTRGPYGGFQLEVSARFWRRITCPTLVVDASRSDFHLAPDELERRLAFLPHARRETLDGAGHMMQRHRPAELARLLIEFLG